MSPCQELSSSTHTQNGVISSVEVNSVYSMPIRMQHDTARSGFQLVFCSMTALQMEVQVLL